MSKKRGTTHRRRNRRDGWAKHDDIQIQAAWAPTEADLDEAKQATHDGVIAALGDRRTGGVRWQISQAPDAFRMLQVMGEDGGPAFVQEVVKPIRARIEAYGGYLVVAMAPGARA